MMYCGILYCTRVCAILFEIFAWSLDNIKYIRKKLWTKSETMFLNFENHYMKKKCWVKWHKNRASQNYILQNCNWLSPFIEPVILLNYACIVWLLCNIHYNNIFIMILYNHELEKGNSFKCATETSKSISIDCSKIM